MGAMEQAVSLVSKATKNNWSRLNTDQTSRLTTRANKKLSTKTVIPKEYLRDKKVSKAAIESLVEYVESNELPLGDVVYSIALQMLSAKELYTVAHGFKEHVAKTIGNCLYSEIDGFPSVCDYLEEFDFIGAVYQALCHEGKKNTRGSYYTPEPVAQDMLRDLGLENGEIILDPCCGSGSILLAAKCQNPTQLAGSDIDEIAVFICKINLLCKYNTHVFIPQVNQCDFLDGDYPINQPIPSYIVTNPPWGAEVSSKATDSKISSKESASLFLEKAVGVVLNEGAVCFLLPKAITNIAVHQDIRRFILNESQICKVKYYPNIFTGVTTEFISMTLAKKGKELRQTFVERDGSIYSVNTAQFLSDKYCVFRFIPDIDVTILNEVLDRGKYSLSNSDWALGIVTGDNKNKLLTGPMAEAEPIITGKEVSSYKLKPCTKYIVYEPSTFQQVAREEYYRCQKKLVYKFISKKLVFAIDTSGTLCLNSANILIPKIQGLSIESVAALLNSRLYQYLYIKLFDDYKVLKGNLMKLPFPQLSSSENEELSNLVKKCIAGLIDDYPIQEYVYSIFDIKPEQRKRIEEVANGAA